MAETLKLSGNYLILYALIYGFSQDGINAYTGTLEYMAQWLSVDVEEVKAMLQKLADARLIATRKVTYSDGERIGLCAVKPNFNTANGND